MFTLLFATASSPPTGRWDGELIGGAPSGHLGNPGKHVPLLGNGYMGLVLSSAYNVSNPGPGHNLTGSILNYWINSNVNWDCEASGEALPPAHCSTRALGGLALTVTGGPLAAEGTRLETEQRMAEGTLWTRRSANATTLETLTYIHPEQNVLVTDLTFSTPEEPIAAPHERQLLTFSTPELPLEVALWTSGRNSHVRASTEAACTFGEGGVPACSRRFHPHGTAGFFAPWSALAATVQGAQPTRTSTATFTEGARYNVSTATQAFRLRAGTVRLVVALADNLLGENEDDPKPAAAALARAASPRAAAAAAAAFWAEYWNASRVSLPTRPTLQGMWYGAQYATACITASAAVLARWRGRVPPPGLYGPFTTADPLVGKCPLPCLRTAPHTPAWWLQGPRPLLRTPERRLRRL